MTKNRTNYNLLSLKQKKPTLISNVGYKKEIIKHTVLAPSFISTSIVKIINDYIYRASCMPTSNFNDIDKIATNDIHCRRCYTINIPFANINYL